MKQSLASHRRLYNTAKDHYEVKNSSLQVNFYFFAVELSSNERSIGIYKITMKQVKVLYRIRCTAEEVEQASRDIAFEQTVEVPEALVTSTAILEEVVGKVHSIEPVPEQPNQFQVVIDYNLDLTVYQLPQFLNLVYGNISIKNNIHLYEPHVK